MPRSAAAARAPGSGASAVTFPLDPAPHDLEKDRVVGSGDGESAGSLGADKPTVVPGDNGRRAEIGPVLRCRSNDPDSASARFRRARPVRSRAAREVAGRAEFGDRLLQLPLGAQGNAEVAVGIGAVGPKPNHLAELGDRLLQLPLLKRAYSRSVGLARSQLCDRSSAHLVWPCPYSEPALISVESSPAIGRPWPGTGDKSRRIASRARALPTARPGLSLPSGPRTRAE